MKSELIFEYSAWFILLCIAIAFGYAFLLYFRDKNFEDLSKQKIYLLAALRFTAVLLISLLLLSPMVRSVITNIENPLIVFAYDNSKSIKIAYKNDTTQLIDFQADISSDLDEISKKFDLKSLAFDSKVFDTLNFSNTGKKTDISALIDYVNSRFYNKNIGALIIATDGIYNDGISPEYQIDKVQYPVYTIALGDTMIHKDLKISKLEHNEVAFVNNDFPLIVTVTAKRMEGKTAVLTISHKGEIIATKQINITTNDFLRKESFYIKAENEGVEQYKVSLTKFDEEINTLNNTKIFAINIVKNKQKILILADAPHPDIMAMNEAISSNANFEVDFYTIDKFNKKITDYNLIILHNLPSQRNNLGNIFTQIRAAKIPAIFILGSQVSYDIFNSFNLGFKVTQQRHTFDNVQAYLNPNFTDFDIDDKLSDLLKNSPPLIVPFGSISMLPQYKALMFRQVKGIKTQIPLVVFSRASENYPSNLCIIAGENFWRLRINNYKKYENFDLFDDFFNKLVQYLIVKSDKRRFIVRVEHIIPEPDDIIFKAEVYDKIYNLVNDNDVELTLKDSVGQIYKYVFTKTQKAYALNIGTFPAGKYSYTATTTQAGEKLRVSGSFVIIKTDLEAQNLVANHALLYKISENTGGKMLYPPQIDSLPLLLSENQSIKPVYYSTDDITEIIRYKWIFFLIISILAVEWFLRKFYGSY